MEKLEIHLPAIEGNEIVYRTGSAAPIELPDAIEIHGDINTIANFIGKRYPVPSTVEALGVQVVDKDRAIVTVNREKFSIVLQTDPENKRSTTVISTLELAPELEGFHINTGKQFTREELVKLIRFNRIFFRDLDQQASMLKSYMTFTANVNANIGNDSDLRGNVNNSYNKSVTTNIPTSFVLNIPVFKGQGKRQFMVEICIDATDKSTRFWFESIELHEMVTIESEQIINKQLECCKDFVIVYK
jgi:hypothetical protein